MRELLFNRQLLTKAVDYLSILTGLHYSLYDDRQRLLIAPAKEDPLLSLIKKHKTGQVFYNNFINTYLNYSMKRKEPLILQRPTGLYHIFIPLYYKDISLVVLSEAFYTSIEDFKKFFKDKGDEFGLTESDIAEFIKNIKVIPLEKVKININNVKSLLEDLIVSDYEKEYFKRQYQWLKTIVHLISNLKSDTPLKDIYQMLIDVVIFLFNVDTAAVFQRKDVFFYVELSGGKKRDIFQKIKLPEKTQFILEAFSSNKPVAVINSHQLWHTGFSEEITSMYLYPIFSERGSLSLLGIFNSLLDKEVLDSISELCKLLARIYNAKSITEEYIKKFNKLSLVSLKTSKLYFLHKDIQHLYDNIVIEAASLADAEKCSLMLPADDKDTLRVNAASGINRWLMENVRVRKGEGIAGKVYEQGMPILIENEEKLKYFSIPSKPQFKTASCLSIPIKIADEILGVINLSDKYSGGPFSEEDIFVLNQFVTQTSILLKLTSCYRTAEEMRELSITDHLTGLFNRRYFNNRFEEELQRSKRYSLPFSLAIVDIDDFKLFNDTEGHLYGDDILKSCASIMDNTIRTNDILARFGGEEFAIIMPQTQKAEAFYVAERIRENIKNMISPTYKNLPQKNITVSIGIATYPDCGEPINNLIKYADMALYKAKVLGKDQTAVWNADAGDIENTGGL